MAIYSDRVFLAALSVVLLAAVMVVYALVDSVGTTTLSTPELEPDVPLTIVRGSKAQILAERQEVAFPVDSESKEETRESSETAVVLSGSCTQRGLGVGGCSVFLVPARHKIADYDVARPFLEPDLPQSVLNRMVGPHEATQTSQGGSFRFEGLCEGHYDLIATKAPLIYSVRRNIALLPRRPVSIDIELPKSGSFFGRLVGPVLMETERIQLALVPKAQQRALAMPSVVVSALPPRQVTGVASDGSFEFTDVPFGYSDILLLLPSSSLVYEGRRTSTGIPERLVLLATVSAPNERARRENVYVGEHVPSFLSLNVNSNISCDVVAWVENTDAGHGTVGGTFSTNSPITLGPLLPGSWNLCVEKVDGSWLYVHNKTVQTTLAGLAASVSVSVP